MYKFLSPEVLQDVDASERTPLIPPFHYSNAMKSKINLITMSTYLRV